MNRRDYLAYMAGKVKDSDPGQAMRALQARDVVSVAKGSEHKPFTMREKAAILFVALTATSAGYKPAARFAEDNPDVIDEIARAMVSGEGLHLHLAEHPLRRVPADYQDGAFRRYEMPAPFLRIIAGVAA